MVCYTSVSYRILNVFNLCLQNSKLTDWTRFGQPEYPLAISPLNFYFVRFTFTLDNGVDLGVQKLFVRLACFFCPLCLQGMGFDVGIFTYTQYPTFLIVNRCNNFLPSAHEYATRGSFCDRYFFFPHSVHSDLYSTGETVKSSSRPLRS